MQGSTTLCNGAAPVESCTGCKQNVHASAAASRQAARLHPIQRSPDGAEYDARISRCAAWLLQQLAGQAERTQQLEGQAQQAEAVQSELQTGLEMTGARLCLVLAAWMCTVAAKHKVGSCSAMCSAPLAA